MKNLYLLLLLIIPSVLYSQSINLYNINSENFPLIEAEFFITDVDGSQVVNVTTDEFSITEQQREKIINEITCSSDSVINNISTVLTLDVSSSMRGAKFDWIKEASSVWISDMDSTREETAITTFDDEALLYSDFNINRESLLDVVQTLELRDGTNFRTAFLDPYAGALDVARRANYQPIIVFLTDGVGTTDFNVGEVVSLAKSMNAIVYAISLEITLPDEIKQVTDATGGLYFEEIDSKNKLIEVYNTIKKIAVSTSPCKISWFTDGCLLGKESKIEYKPLGVSKEFKFDKPGFEPPQFEFIDGEFALFDCNVPNVFTMRLRALNSNIEVSSIDKVSGINACSQFEVTVIGKQFPFVLEKDSIMELEIEYLGTNAEYNFCQFTINSSTCLNVDFYSVSNCLNSPPQNNVLNVLEPNGGEVIQSGSKQNIFWKGTLKEKTKIIEYSTNSGVSWNLVNSGKLDRSIEWNTPNVESDECLVRVQQMSEMAGRKLYSLNIDSLDINKISWNNAGNVFAILSENGKIYLVNSVIGQIANVFDLGSNGEGDLNFLPDGVRLLYSSSNGTQLINLITQDVTNISSFGGEIEFSFRSDVGVIFNDNEARILDLRTLSFINQFDLPFGASQITDAAISKSSNSIVISTATVSKSDSIYILDKRDTWANFDVRTMIDDIFKHSYQFVEWSQDEKYIISTSNIGDEKWLEIWDISTGNKLEKLFRPTFSEIRDLSASYYDDYVVLVDRGFNVIVWEWDISNENIFSKKYEFKSESIVNNDIEWSKDGTRFAVGQTGTKQDSLLTVFSVKSYPELLDISDSTFSLVKNTIIAKDVDMGNVLITSSKDSTLNSLLDYSYTFEIEIDSIEITGIDRNSFSISNSPNLPTQISDTKQPDFIIEFSPSKQGAHNALAVVYSKYGISEFRLLGNGVQPIIGKNDISFGEVNVGSEKLITQTSLVNNGTSTLTINSIEIISPSKDQFKLFDQSNEVSQINDIELDSEEEYDLTASFAPTNDLLYNSRIRVIYINEFNNTDTLNIKIDGRGIKPLLEYYEYNFGIVQCDESIEDSITIYNNGSGVLKISEIELNRINFEFLDNSLEFIDILENDSARIGIRFRPIDYGIIKDSIVFISNSYKDSVKVMYLNGRRLNTSFEVIGNTNFVGIDDNTAINEEFDIENDGRTNLVWNTPMVSNDGRIVINSVNPNPTLPGESSTVSVTINTGEKGEIYKYKFSPSPICADSIELNAEVKSTSPTLYYNPKDEYRIVCDDEYTISIPVNNIGEAQLTIDSLKLSEINNSFVINDNSFSLLPNQMDTIDITFNNSIPGTYRIELQVYSNDSKSEDGITSIPIIVIKEISDFEIIEEDVTFDYLNNNIPGTKIVRLVNNGTIPIRWDLDLSSDYTILSVEPPIAGVGDTSVIKLIYTGNKEIFATDKFIVRDSCETEKQIDINILGKGSETININLSNERRNIGEKFNLKLFFSSSKSFNDGEVLKGNLEFNRTLMRPNNSNSVTEGGIRKVPFEIENINSNFEYEIAMEALWGNDSCTNVSVTDLTMLNANVNIDYSTQGGSLCIEDLCYADGVRLLKFNFENQNEIKIENNQDGVIIVNVNTIEKSDIEILLYDFYGRIINSENFPSSDNNEYKLFVGEINSGSYFIQVKTYSQTFNKKLLIVN